MGRTVDGVIFTFFLLLLAGFGLVLAGQGHTMVVVTEAKKMGGSATVLKKIFPFPDNKYEHNLTHILLFGLLIALLSMMHHYAQDTIKEKVEKQQKKEKKRKEREKQKQKEAEAERKKNPEKKA